MASHERGQPLPKARADQLIVEELPDEVVVYDWGRHEAHCLNQTAAMVWKQCDGRTTVPEIARRVGRELKAPVREEVVWLALDGLGRRHLLEERAQPGPGAARVSRRTAMKVGLAGATALPLVTSIIAPTASQAATCIPNSPNCKKNGNTPANECFASSECCSCCCHTRTGIPADAHCASGGGIAGCLPG
jgi:coenzyme PQQ synthesis protein D (PqqD)